MDMRIPQQQPNPSRAPRPAAAAIAVAAASQAPAGAAAVYSGVCHGTLGELWQGPCGHAGAWHIGLLSMPVRRYSWMHFFPGEDGEGDRGLGGKERCRRLIDAYLHLHGKTLPAGHFRHDSELPTGKGMASSSADLVATVRCLDQVFGLETTLPALATLLRGIERSDPVFLDHPALYLSARQQVLRVFAAAPPLHACYIDEGGQVDTEALETLLLRYYEGQRGAYRALLQLALHGFAEGNAAAICEAATGSARLAQAVTPKHNFEHLLRHRRELGADGVMVAHTGSILGYLFAQRPDSHRLGEVSAFFAGLGRQCRCIEVGA